MNLSQRIKIDTNNISDNHLKVKLEQNINTLEFLTMNIDLKEVYQNFNADYGVLVGRVIANGGIGIPNAKIGVFIPLSDDDINDDQIANIYPYKTPKDKNKEGKRYNLLPRVGKINPTTGVSSPKQPFGSFPTKEEILVNENQLNIYKKYYKYTTVTNNSGDYMIFGVPVGNQTIHLSVDITDIGDYSMTPAAMVTNLGYSANLFTDNNSKIKSSTDLNDLPHIETQEINVDIIPFWGDSENFEIGITQQNFRIRSVLNNVFYIFGSVFTDGDGSMWGADFGGGTLIRQMFRAVDDANKTVGIYSKRIGKITEKIYYYPNTVTDDEIDSDAIDPRKKMLVLDPSEYSIYKRDGDFVFIINCNRGRVITDDFGNQMPVDDNSTSGIFTKFRGFMTLEITPEDIPMDFSGRIGDPDSYVTPIRYKLKFPQFATNYQTFSKNENLPYTQNWRKQHYTFEAGKFYSLAKFHGTTSNNDNDDYEQTNVNPQTNNNAFLGRTFINRMDQYDPFWNVGVIVTSSYGSYNNDDYQFPYNNTDSNGNNVFVANWLNLAVYLPQVGYLRKEYSQVYYVRTTDNFHIQTANSNAETANNYYPNDNIQEIAAGELNTKWFARSDLHWTDFIEVPITDIKAMKSVTYKGFKDNIVGLSLNGSYRNGQRIPTNNSWPSAIPIAGDYSNTYYFYKGWGEANCIDFLFNLGIVN